MQRVAVALSKNGENKIPKFSECILDYFRRNANSITVKCCLSNGFLTLTESEEGVQLYHSSECPLRIISNSNDIDDVISTRKNLNINVAVSMIIETSDNFILLTRRPAHMRSHPKVWVPPGGHLEYGETLMEGGLREVEEETGLNIKDCDMNILCLWENVYPLLLGLGSPINHVLVVYVHALVRETHKQLTAKINPDPQEVSAFCWLNAQTVSQLFTPAFQNLKQSQYILSNGNIVEKPMEAGNMFSRQLWAGDKIYSGVQCALKSWLYKTQKHKLLSKF